MDEWNALNPAAHATLHALQPIMMMMTIMLMMVNLKVEEEVVRKLAPFKPVPPARPPHLARTL